MKELAKQLKRRKKRTKNKEIVEKLKRIWKIGNLIDELQAKIDLYYAEMDRLIDEIYTDFETKKVKVSLRKKRKQRKTNYIH